MVRGVSPTGLTTAVDRERPDRQDILDLAAVSATSVSPLLLVQASLGLALPESARSWAWRKAWSIDHLRGRTGSWPLISSMLGGSQRARRDSNPQPTG